ncbi:hypothetical protein FH608_030065 [Nonomuraea phyllanthi]|uniref:Uncharacterized protein n=1 Tax=Nonomuraea phyllanthi TaxID=2219224 RepID=A0A5C4W1N2_9ACTN|nr:hypothetical protein [Nonomuraea phyllanthi]KAB8191505.1 hypothetical protein FH608_030065 [Nonomuraea phyllanthi]
MTRRVAFPDLHGPHVEPPEPHHIKLTWHEPTNRAPRIRIISYSCECEAILYELCSAAGQGFIRRTDREQGTVHETAWTLTLKARRTFNRILRGKAR